MQEKLENQDDVSRNHRYRRIQMQLCKDLDRIVHSQGYVKKVTIVMDSIWFDRKYDLIYELIWLFTKKYSPFVISNFLLISGSPMFIQGKTSKQDQTYMLHLNMAEFSSNHSFLQIQNHCETILLMLPYIISRKYAVVWKF